VRATKDWGNLQEAKVLVIGHDPRLQKSSTIADCCFFANYYFRPMPTQKNEQRKYSLAKSVFDYIRDITSKYYQDEEIYLTNLCNDALPNAPEGKTVFIPLEKAENGLKNIRRVLSNAKIEFIFPMSMQVNYWLQKLGFYNSNNGFVECAKPSLVGIENEPPYYKESVGGQFRSICGYRYVGDDKYNLFPILHVKNYPPDDRFLTYQLNYEQMREEICAIKEGKPYREMKEGVVEL
jgi:hypothetical protein